MVLLALLIFDDLKEKGILRQFSTHYICGIIFLDLDFLESRKGVQIQNLQYLEHDLCVTYPKTNMSVGDLDERRGNLR